ncbi:MAG: hypothetical protein H7A13_03560 [Pseudomonadales bacterium]|nr:hypothetical protein [Pseudomonadales bacterium]
MRSGVIQVQQIAEAAPEIIVLAAWGRGQQPGVALEVGPAGTAAVAVEVFELDGLFAQEIDQAHMVPAAQRA